MAFFPHDKNDISDENINKEIEQNKIIMKINKIQNYS